jgi:hypothetical protein
MSGSATSAKYTGTRSCHSCGGANSRIHVIAPEAVKVRPSAPSIRRPDALPTLIPAARASERGYSTVIAAPVSISASEGSDQVRPSGETLSKVSRAGPLAVRLMRTRGRD